MAKAKYWDVRTRRLINGARVAAWAGGFFLLFVASSILALGGIKHPVQWGLLAAVLVAGAIVFVCQQLARRFERKTLAKRAEAAAVARVARAAAAEQERQQLAQLAQRGNVHAPVTRPDPDGNVTPVRSAFEARADQATAAAAQPQQVKEEPAPLPTPAPLVSALTLVELNSVGSDTP